MNLLLSLIILSVSLYVNCHILVQLHTITRHGERSPCFTYDNEPYQHLWTRGLGQLTNHGIEQLKEVGTFLRKQYGNFIPEAFHKRKIHIRSSDTDRTIMSALAAMQGLFKDQIVPIHTVPKLVDYQLKMTSHCPYHKKMLKQEYKKEKWASIIFGMKDFFKHLENYTYLNNIDISLALRICDVITVWHQLKLPMPLWTNDYDTLQTCLYLGHLKFIISYTDTKLTQYRGAPLVEMILDNMVNRAQMDISSKNAYMLYYGYFTHDSTMSAFLGHLQIFNRLKPPLASTIIIELYNNSKQSINSTNKLSQFSIVILLRNSTSLPPYPLNIPLCSGHNKYECRLDIFVKLFGKSILPDLLSSCNITDYNKLIASATRGAHTISSSSYSSSITGESATYLFYKSLFTPIFILKLLIILIFIKIFFKISF